MPEPCNAQEGWGALNHLQEAVVHNADWVNRVLVSGTGIAGVVVLLKILGHSEFEWQDVKISVQGAWLVFTLFTFAHGYAAWLLIRSTHTLWASNAPKEAEETFLKVSSTGSLFVRGMIPRTKRIQHGDGYIYLMDPKDPSTWLAHGAVILMIAATIPFKLGVATIFLALGSLVLSFVNWQIGSHWVIALSELTVPNDEAHYNLRLAMQREGITTNRAGTGGKSLKIPGRKCRIERVSGGKAHTPDPP